MEFCYLKEQPEFISQIATWYFDQWAYLMDTPNIQLIEDKLQSQLNSNKIPLMLLLIEQGKLLGVCQLKFHEMDIYPEKEHWLGGVYICEHQRGRGLAQKMVIKAKEIATSLGIKTLYLQTTELSGGIYKKLGWQPTAQITSKGEQVLVMQCDLSKSEKVSINDPLI